MNLIRLLLSAWWLYNNPGPPGPQYAALREMVLRNFWRMLVSLDIEKLKHEVEQLGVLDAERQSAEATLASAEAEATVAINNADLAASSLAQISSSVSGQIAYITGLLGVTSPVPDPTPDPTPDPEPEPPQP